MNTKNSYFSLLENKYGELTLGQALKSWRMAEGLTQRDFASRLKISAQNLNDIENERKIPSPKRASVIAKRLKISEIVLIQLALRDQLRKEGFKYDVKLA